MAPQWALFPLVGLATAATVIASQALITAAFSVTKQAVQLGYIPRLRLLHTSVRASGQIYIPFVNWSLYACVVFAVVVFGSSSALASAYGIAVTIDMTITTVMTFFVIRHAWKLPLGLCVAATGLFFAVDIVFLSANLVKVLEGGWFPLAIGGAVFALMTTWHAGRRLMAERLRDEALELEPFVESLFLAPPLRVPGTAVFLSAEQGSTPFALLHNLKHNKVLHAQNLFVTVVHHELPWIGFDRRVELRPLGHDCWQVTLHFGFKNEPDVPEALKLLAGRGIELDEMETSYFLSRDTVVPKLGRAGGGMARWREKLFASMHRNAAAAADFLHLPTNRIVELGTKVEV
jgi:KUP system potassium uptake protein